jgi:hypothetical protein
MTTAYVTRFVLERPFVPFVMLLTNGREHVITHSDFVALGEYAAVLLVFHPAGQVEVIDSELIVSFCTLYESDSAQWSP